MSHEYQSRNVLDKNGDHAWRLSVLKIQNYVHILSLMCRRHLQSISGHVPLCYFK